MDVVRVVQALHGGVYSHEDARHSGLPTLTCVVDGDDRGKRPASHRQTAQFKIGRSVASDLRLADGKISRDHCVIESVRDQYTSSSTSKARNGTIVNGDRVKKTVLKEGDFIRLGFTMLKYDRV
jgi:pSer/pThr/pTyr-binding forkhead associated (FHA) protein